MPVLDFTGPAGPYTPPPEWTVASFSTGAAATAQLDGAGSLTFVSLDDWLYATVGSADFTFTVESTTNPSAEAIALYLALSADTRILWLDDSGTYSYGALNGGNHDYGYNQNDYGGATRKAGQKFTLQRVGNQLVHRVHDPDATLVHEFTKTIPSYLLSAGKVGFQSYSYNARFDSVSLSVVGGAPPASVARAGTAQPIALSSPAGLGPGGAPTTSAGRAGIAQTLVLSSPGGTGPGSQPGPVQTTVQGSAQTVDLYTEPGYADLPTPLSLEILDTQLGRAPTVAVAVVTDSSAAASLSFAVDGVAALSTEADEAGNLEPTSIPVGYQSLAGSHVLSVDDGTSIATATFTLAGNPALHPRGPGPDTNPVEVPETLVEGVRRWVLQDLLPGGLGSYVMPTNPSVRSGALVERTFSAAHSTARGGSHAISGGGPSVLTWSLVGYSPARATYDELDAYGQLNRRFWMVDDRFRAWPVAFVSVDLVPRGRQVLVEGPDRGTFTDWVHDYKITVAVYSEKWRRPQSSPSTSEIEEF